MKEEKKTGWQILPVLALAGLVLMFGIVTTRDLSSDKTSRQEPAQDVKRVDRPDYVGLAQSLGPVVVNISTIYNGPGPEETSPFGQGGPSTDEFRKNFFGHHSNPAPQPVRSLALRVRNVESQMARSGSPFFLALMPPSGARG